MIHFTIHQQADDVTGSRPAWEHVHAYEMTDTQFRYRCSCKRGYHWHGNGGDPFKNRREFRSSHCETSKDDRELCIHIDERTTRTLKSSKQKV